MPKPAPFGYITRTAGSSKRFSSEAQNSSNESLFLSEKMIKHCVVIINQVSARKRGRTPLPDTNNKEEKHYVDYAAAAATMTTTINTIC
ncbi:hypothetical protein E2C01_034649 [Portunus trituberculatus]|uniref:Uncharacterized protein n=1 Tax=Portunus trituberculatus TaxID=210409 RepID=A0A5B7F7H5_PORTR|nr:hypothetical protein [Portunus trituberculatus]